MSEAAMACETLASRPRRLHVAAVLLIVGAPLLFLMLLLWSVFRGEGPVVAMGDWEFRAFGQVLPIFNVAAPVIICMLLGVLLDGLLTRRWRRKVEKAMLQRAMDDAAPMAAYSDGGVGSAGRFTRALTMVGSGLIVTALLVTAWAICLPAQSPAAVIRGSATQAVSAPYVATGAPNGRLATTVVQDMLVTQRLTYFVPIIDPAEPKLIRDFVEFVPDKRWNGTSVPEVDPGTSWKAYPAALPRFVHVLYSEGGYAVSPTYHVLASSPSAIQAPYWIVAMQLGLLGVMVLAAALLQRRHAHRLARRYQASLAPA
ncbi:hypothetical protein CP98_04514 [Sphingobium yanoikuyae]|uniref:Uncharacterized protein n=1 Tax=Sphingobium yanoikuyae TaxID=13690 RepID=A0A084EBD6_SPHYA|nr:hypothetical protein [Sphingobium yanoikuyae]KEZ15278.1 hypothetical protein CP98_04514 [Sphingobium yanoikuyae]